MNNYTTLATVRQEEGGEGIENTYVKVKEEMDDRMDTDGYILRTVENMTLDFVTQEVVLGSNYDRGSGYDRNTGYDRGISYERERESGGYGRGTNLDRSTGLTRSSGIERGSGYDRLDRRSLVDRSSENNRGATMAPAEDLSIDVKKEVEKSEDEDEGAAEYPCVVCSKEVTNRSHALCCDKCSKWQHRKCKSGVSAEDYRLLVNGDLELDWNCFTCSPPAKKKGLGAGRQSTAAASRRPAAKPPAVPPAPVYRSRNKQPSSKRSPDKVYNYSDQDSSDDERRLHIASPPPLSKDSGDSSDDSLHGKTKKESPRVRSSKNYWAVEVGKVVMVMPAGSRGDKDKDNWFPGLVVMPTAEKTLKVEPKTECLVRSFMDGRFHVVLKKEVELFDRDCGKKLVQGTLKRSVSKALLFLTDAELPSSWDANQMFGQSFPFDKSNTSSTGKPKDTAEKPNGGQMSPKKTGARGRPVLKKKAKRKGYVDTSDESETDSEKETAEERDHFAAQLYNYMDQCGTPIMTEPTVGGRDLDLHRLYKVVHSLGGASRVMNQNLWQTVAEQMTLTTLGDQAPTLIKDSYKRYLESFDQFYRKLGGLSLLSVPRGSRTRQPSQDSAIAPTQVKKDSLSLKKDTVRPKKDSPTTKKTAQKTERETPSPKKDSQTPKKETTRKKETPASRKETPARPRKEIVNTRKATLASRKEPIVAKKEVQQPDKDIPPSPTKASMKRSRSNSQEEEKNKFIKEEEASSDSDVSIFNARYSQGESSDDEPTEEKDYFVAQLYMFMESRLTPINKAPTVGGKDLDLYKLYKVVERLGGSNVVSKKNLWRSVTNRMHLQFVGVQAPNLISAAYKRFLESFEQFYRKLGGCPVMSSAPRSVRTSSRSMTKEADKISPTTKSTSERKPQVKKETKSEPDDSDDDSDRDSDESPLMTKNATEISPTAKKDIKKQVKEEDDDMDEYSDDESDSEISDEEILQERDHFVAQLYKFMEERGTPINKGPTVGGKDIDLYRLYNVVHRMGGFNKVTNQKKWKVVTNKMGLQFVGAQAHYLIKATYKRFLEKFETFYRKLGLNPTLIATPSSEPRASARSTRVLSRDLDRSPNAATLGKDVKKELKKDIPKIAAKDTVASAKEKKKEPEKIPSKGTAKDAGSTKNVKDNKNGGKKVPVSDEEESDEESSEEETTEEKDHFVAQLYKFMEESGTPINNEPRVGRKDLDLFRLYKVVNKIGGSSRVNNQNLWKEVMEKMDLLNLGTQGPTQVKQAYKRYLENFDTFNRKLGCTVFSSPRDSLVTPGTDGPGRPGRSMIRRHSNAKKDSSSEEDKEDKDDDSDETDTESGSDECREEKENFVSQLYKFMEESGSPILKSPTIGRANLDLYQLFNVVQKLGGFGRVMNQNQWLEVANKMDLKNVTAQTPNLLRAAYKRYLESYEKYHNKHGNSSVISCTISRDTVVTHETILYPGGARTESITPARGRGRVASRQAPQKEMKDVESSDDETDDESDSPQSTNKTDGPVGRNVRRQSRQSMEEEKKKYKDLSDEETDDDLSDTSDESKKKTSNIKKQPTKRVKKKDHLTSDEEEKVENTQVPKKRGPVARKQPLQKDKDKDKDKVNERKPATPAATKRTTQANARRPSSKTDMKIKSKEYISDDDSDDSTGGSPLSKPKIVSEIKPPILKVDNKLDESSDDSEGRLVISSSPPKPKINNNARKSTIRKVGTKLSSEDESDDSNASHNSKKILNNSRRSTAQKESTASKRSTAVKEKKKMYDYSTDDSEGKGSTGSYGKKREIPPPKLQPAASPPKDSKMIYDFSDDDSDDDRLVISDIVKKPRLSSRNSTEREKKNIDDIYSNEESEEDESDASHFDKKITPNSRKPSNQKEKKNNENISDSDDSDDSSEDDTEAKDSFVAQLFSFTESSGNPINEEPKVGDHDLDLYKMYKVVENHGGSTRVNNQNLWRDVANNMGLAELPGDPAAQIKAAYRKYLEKFEIFQRKLGCSIMTTNPGGSRSSRNLIRESDKSPRATKRKNGNGNASTDSSEGENETRKKKGRKHFLDERYFKKNRRKNNGEDNSSTAAAVEAAVGANTTQTVVDTTAAVEDAASKIKSVGISAEDLSMCHSEAKRKADGEVYQVGLNDLQSVTQYKWPSEIQQQQKQQSCSGMDLKGMAVMEEKESSVKEPFIMLTKLSNKQINQALGDPQSTESNNHKEGSQPGREIEVNGNLMIPIEEKSSSIYNRDNYTEQGNPSVTQNEHANAEELISKLHHKETAQSSTVGNHLQSKSLFHKNVAHDSGDQTHGQDSIIQNFAEENHFECRECQLKFITMSELSGHRCKKIAVKPYKWTAVVLNRDP